MCSWKITDHLHNKWVSCPLGNTCLPTVWRVFIGITSCVAAGCPAIHLPHHSRPVPCLLLNQAAASTTEAAPTAETVFIFSLFYWKSFPPSGLVIAPHRFRIDCF